MFACPSGKVLTLVVASILASASASVAHAQDDLPPAHANGGEPRALAGARPQIALIRWQEDWSALADPALRTQPLDALKHIALSDDPDDFVSLGINVRERFVHQDAFGFGLLDARDDYLLNRLQAHLDLRLHDHFEAFVQLQEVTAPGRTHPGPVDRDRGDLSQAFVGWHGESDGWRYALRVGRQEVAFDLERFVSIREGPNVRQAFDAVAGELDHGAWSIRALVSHPVQYRPGSFDDHSNARFAFHALRIERGDIGPGAISGYVGRYLAYDAVPGASPVRDRRDIMDLRYFAPKGPLQFDIEAMRQTGRLGPAAIDAWAVGARGRYELRNVDWHPKIGLQADFASGTRRERPPGSGTFSPLFSNGLYFTQADYTTYANLIHVKPTVTLSPSPAVTVLTGIGVQWRARTSDAVYVQPAIPLKGTAGTAGRFTGTYFQGRGDWRVTANTRFSIEAVRFDIGDALRRAGAKDATYVSGELAFAW